MYPLVGVKAAGAHYKAFGFYYILCWSVSGMYVAVYRATDKQLVGSIPKEGGFEEKEDYQC